MVEIIDTTNTIIQSILVSYFPYYCLKKENSISGKDSIIKFISSSVLIFILIKLLTNSIGGTSLSIIIMNLSNMMVIGLIYFKNYRKALTSYFIVYFLMQVSIILFSNLNWSYIEVIVGNKEFAKIMSVYLPALVVEFIIIFLSKQLYSLYKLFSKYKYYFEVAFFVAFAFDYVLCLSLTIHGNHDVVFKNITIISSMIFILLLALYFANINKKIVEIERLNVALNDKNNELKKIKHDYGSQISYINGLYIMEQYERLGDLLKSIIDGNNQISDNIKIISSEESIIADVVNSLNITDVNIIVEEEAELNDLKISEYELHKILSNIVSNAITAMNKKGLIIIKTYRIFGNLYISIKNNGPKIDENVINRIFDSGFTTKKDNGKKENGFGLAIVKEIVENNNGKINVESNNDYTEFKMIFRV